MWSRYAMVVALGLAVPVARAEAQAGGSTQGSQSGKGMQGSQGMQGPEGSQGMQGPEGSQGPQGMQGSQGMQGAQGSQGMQGYQASQGSQSDSANLIKTPAGAQLVGTAVVDEIRAFPEMTAKGMLKGKAQAEKIVGVEGVDRVFKTDKAFADTVSYFDSQFKQGGSQSMARVETDSAVAWTVKRPDGTIANAVVRNTSPTTIEIAEVNSATAKIEHP